MENRNPLSEEQYLERKEKKDYSPRTDYFRDQTAIIHSMPFRRLKHKTQVFFSPENDHVCTRIEHVLHVASVAATICKGLNKANSNWKLNEELAYAIGLGHDIGHTPFGHTGESVLKMLLKDIPINFAHEINSFRVVEYIANEGEGLNLTYAVKDGIICHCGENFEQEIKPRNDYINLDEITTKGVNPSTFEGCIARFSDKIAYMGRDIEDAILAKIIIKENIPAIILSELESYNKEITNGHLIDIFVNDLINTSKNLDEIKFSTPIYNLMLELRDFNYKNIYQHPKIERWRKHGENILKYLFEYYQELLSTKGKDQNNYDQTHRLEKDFSNFLLKMKSFYITQDSSSKIIIADYIAGMTDEYALRNFEYLTKPIF